MKYVLFPYDYRPYEEHLPEFVDQLPEGARRFATDPDHYDFSAARCVKDLLVDRINYFDDYQTVDVEIGFRFEPRPGPHPPALVIRYIDVRTFSIDVGSASRRGSGWATSRWTRSFPTNTVSATSSRSTPAPSW